MSRDNVARTIRQILKQERVKTRSELAAKLDWKHPQPLNRYENRMNRGHQREQMVQTLLLEGWKYDEISRRVGMNWAAVRQIVWRIYKKNGIPKSQGRVGLGRKLGLELTRFGRDGHNDAPPTKRCSTSAERGEIACTRET
jgi:DNA-binding NarL/FixJ family response regulator